MDPAWEDDSVMEATAADYKRQGDLLQGKPAQAEPLYQKALMLYDRLFRETENPIYAGSAGDICESLADLSMQQGNMHGADYYYALLLRYQSP